MKLTFQPAILSGLSLGLAIAGYLFAVRQSQVQAQTSETAPQPELAGDRSAWLPSPAAAPTVLNNADPSPNTDRVVPGDDDRVPMNNRNYPWSAVGRIVAETADGSISLCTGTLIAEDVVLTNAHCALTPETQQLHKRIAFQPNLINGAITNADDMAWVKEVWLGTDFTTEENPDPNDWALVKLDRPLGDRYGTLRWQALPADVLLSKAGRLNLVGYSGDFPPDHPGGTAGVHQGCSIIQDDDPFWIHDCDTTGGASGGPILAEIEGDFYVVALHAGGVTGENDEPLFNYAIKIDQIEAGLQ
ncbi:MAG: trypsin-like serine protease [Leptolyngbyaceae cyanobacterium SM1_1_3]|nr:trypsin-like serine protease [Leptolyngbyaceae cyanobacterium SM1_1_3]NJO10078.1 trypsin-like serine protease [Leptolyngbyaceae cyanobacterium SL_1_1]